LLCKPRIVVCATKDQGNAEPRLNTLCCPSELNWVNRKDAKGAKVFIYFLIGTPVKYVPVRFSEPTPDEHPKGTRFNRASGADRFPQMNADCRYTLDTGYRMLDAGCQD